VTFAVVRGQLIALALAALAAAAARAEPAYVIEQLVVNVNSAPDASGERIATVKSGDRLEVLERVGDQVHVRLPSGSEGWIRATYLSKDEPLRSRLTQREADVAQLKDQVSRLESQLAAARAAPAQPPPAAAGAAGNSAGAPAAAAASAEDPAGPTAGTMFAGAADDSGYRVWPWALGAALAGLGVGFALGALVLDRYIRRKYGGLRIY
jgi:SH3-like domain-containing protein